MAGMSGVGRGGMHKCGKAECGNDH
jgi:hypothetical protein